MWKNKTYSIRLVKNKTKKDANENRKEARLGNTFKIKYTTQKGTIEKSFKN